MQEPLQPNLTPQPPKKRSLRLAGFTLLIAAVGIMMLIMAGPILLRVHASNPNLPGDENNDGVVDILDLSILLSHWGQTGAAYAAPSITITASPTAIYAGQSATVTWSATNATGCTAPWTSSTSTGGSQSVSPTVTTAYTITCTGYGGSSNASATVTINAGSVSCSQTLTGFQTAQLQSDSYHLQANEWGSNAVFSICNDGGIDFMISSSSINNATNGGPGGYPSLYKGCHWGWCTTNSGMPLAVSAMTGTPNKVTTDISMTTVGSGAWDGNYDIWFNPNTSTNDNSTGMEMMLWLNHNGSIQPGGSIVNNNVTIDGMSWTVWKNGTSPGGTVSYVLNSPAASVNALDLGPFAADAAGRGYMTSAWYLIDVEAGFEPWQGGTGLAVNSFDVNVN